MKTEDKFCAELQDLLDKYGEYLKEYPADVISSVAQIIHYCEYDPARHAERVERRASGVAAALKIIIFSSNGRLSDKRIKEEARGLLALIEWVE